MRLYTGATLPKFVWIYLYVYNVFLCIQIGRLVSVCVYVYVCVYVCMYVLYVYLCMYVYCMCIYILYACICIYVLCICVYIYIYIYVCIYVCVYVYCICRFRCMCRCRSRCRHTTAIDTAQNAMVKQTWPSIACDIGLMERKEQDIFLKVKILFNSRNLKKGSNIHTSISNNLPIKSEFVTRVLGPTLNYDDVIMGNVITLINRDVYYMLISLLSNTARRGNPSLTTRWENRKTIMSIQHKQVSCNMCFKPMRSDVIKRKAPDSDSNVNKRTKYQDEKYIKEEICDEAANGNSIIHKKVCTCYKRMINGISEYISTVTGEKYKINEKYKCENNELCISCNKRNMQYAVYWENFTQYAKKT